MKQWDDELCQSAGLQWLGNSSPRHIYHCGQENTAPGHWEAELQKNKGMHDEHTFMCFCVIEQIEKIQNDLI